MWITIIKFKTFLNRFNKNAAYSVYEFLASIPKVNVMENF